MTYIKKIIVIPARYASKRFPGKMLAKIGSKTLIQHTFENAKKSKRIDDILVATDDEKIFEEAKKFKAEVVMTSKKALNGTLRVFEALQKSKKVTKDAIVINIQGDEPMLDPRAIDKLYDLLQKNPKVKMATLVTPIQTKADFLDPSVVKCVFDLNCNALYFSRSPIPHTSDFSKAYQHLGVYAFRKSFLDTYCKLAHTSLDQIEDLEQLKVLENGYSIKVLVDLNPSIGVDTPNDLKKVKQYLCR